MRVNFVSSKDTGETRTIYVWSSNESIMGCSDTDNIIRELHRVSLRRGGSYIKSPEWLLNKGASVNPKNKNDDECLWWSTISASNYNEIVKKRV